MRLAEPKELSSPHQRAVKAASWRPLIPPDSLLTGKNTGNVVIWINGFTRPEVQTRKIP